MVKAVRSGLSQRRRQRHVYRYTMGKQSEADSHSGGGSAMCCGSSRGGCKSACPKGLTLIHTL